MGVPAAAPAPERLGYIDGLRAVAALSVFAYHAWLYLPGHAGRDTPWGRVLLMGAHGVDLFFVISGFCLAYPYLARLRRDGTYRFDGPSYAARRFLRILPPYYAAIVLLAIAYPLLGVHSSGLAPAALAEQFLFLDRHQSFLTPVFWTLAVEFRWYFAFPFLLYAYARAPRAVGVLGVAAYLLFYGTRDAVVDLGTLPAFLLGIWAADLEISQSPLRRYALAVGIPCAFASLGFASGEQFYAVHPVGVVAAFALVVAAGALPALRGALSFLPMRTIGLASYSIYLLHDPVLDYCEKLRDVPVAPAALLALVVSFAFFACFERPFLSGRLRDRLLRGAGAAPGRALAYLGLPRAVELGE